MKTYMQRLDSTTIAFASIPALLYLPVLYYSLDTPFALQDDYILWRSLTIFGFFDEWLYAEFFRYDLDDGRFKPFWDFYHGATWKVFGPTPWLHHLMRWIEHFGAIAASAAAYLCFQRRNRNVDCAASRRLVRLLPLAALVYLWIFFPNQPAARLSPNVVHSALFLAICAWMTALMLRRQGKPQSRRSALLIYGAFCVSFCGLLWSKEPNIAAALWLLISYYALLAIEALRRQSGSRISAVSALKGISVWKALGGLPLIVVFLDALNIIYVLSQQGGYGTSQLTRELLIDNAAWIAEGLFQVQTSLIITGGLALLSAALLTFVVVNIAKRRFSDELIYALFLLGLFVSSYLILCASWAQIMRYWYVLIPVFTMLMAFSAKFALEFAAQFNFARILPSPQSLTAYALTAFIAFFVCCNYYNFLYQTVVQHITRHNEANLIAETTRLLAQGQHVQIVNLSYWHTYELILYFHEFLPRFYGENYEVHTEPPQQAGQPHYKVRHFWSVKRRPEIEENYRTLTYAYRVADLLQSGSPYSGNDAGASITLWHIYDDKGDWIWWNGETLDIRRLVAEAGAPVIRSDFDVYLNDRLLIYINDKCSAANLDDTFFLGVFPVDTDDLPESRRSYKFHNLDFSFANYGFGGGERCIAVRDLPGYPIKWIHTGQYIALEDGWHNTWEGEFTFSRE